MMRSNFVSLVDLVNLVLQLRVKRHVIAASAIVAVIASITTVATWRGDAAIGVTAVVSFVTTALVTAVLGGVRTVRWRERV
jgi:hypothetical protein